MINVFPTPHEESTQHTAHETTRTTRYSTPTWHWTRHTSCVVQPYVVHTILQASAAVFSTYSSCVGRSLKKQNAHFGSDIFRYFFGIFPGVKIPRYSTGYGIIPWSRGMLKIPFLPKLIPWNPCLVPCKPVRFEISQSRPSQSRGCDIPRNLSRDFWHNGIFRDLWCIAQRLDVLNSKAGSHAFKPYL